MPTHRLSFAVRGRGWRHAGGLAFDPDGTYVVDPARLDRRHPVTPYAGRTLTGRVRQTWLHGIPLLEGECETPVGRLLKRG